jgi:hypothetical protein
MNRKCYKSVILTPPLLLVLIERFEKNGSQRRTLPLAARWGVRARRLSRQGLLGEVPGLL